MAKDQPVQILDGSFGLGPLARFAELLNMTDYWNASLIEGRKKIGGDYRAIQTELRRLVQAWFKSGPNIAKLIDANPAVSLAATDFRPHFISTQTGTARLAFLRAPEYQTNAKPLEVALGLFRDFLFNPDNDRLGGPCKSCENYYVRKSERERTVYCSKRCGHLFTSRQANRIKRKREHKKKLKVVKTWIGRWRTAETTKSWKEWITGKQPTIKKMWLTQAVKRGEIKEPFKARGRPRRTRRAAGSPHRR